MEIGHILRGELRRKAYDHRVSDIPKAKTKIYVNLANPEAAFDVSQLPVDGVGLARQEFIINDYIGEHPLAMLKQGRSQEYVERLAEGIAKIASSFYPRLVIVRLSDFKTDEYRSLEGGKLYEITEANPMIGWRGASRYIHPKFKEAFKLECCALKKVRDEMKLTNVIIMVPFCRTVSEGKEVLRIMKKNGLRRGKNGLKIYVMAEIPSNIILAEEFAKLFDGFSIGSNDLTQLTLGIDRNSALIASAFDERNDAIKKSIVRLIKASHKTGKPVGICGEAPSNYPDFVRFLVGSGIDSISVEPDAAIRTRFTVARAEKNLQK
jgi:pyruvate,water dikinase